MARPRPDALPPVFRMHLPEPYGTVVADVGTYTMGEQARQRGEVAKLRKHVADTYGTDDLSADDILVSVAWVTVRRTHDVSLVELWEALTAADIRDFATGADALAEDSSPEA